MFRARTAVLGAAALAGTLVAGLTAGSPAATSAPAPATSVATASPVGAPAGNGESRSGDIKDRVAALPGVSSVTEATAPAGYRFFKITFTQPDDHRHPRRGTFEQRLTLLHKDVGRPMVMYTGGYYVSQNPSRSEPTQIVDGNQLSMEYRFFEPSRPANPDWPRQLTIWQAATDQHRIVKSFQRLYRENWITTGGSKGGMTATYHRHFYPRDVDGTVPYVAPNDVVDSRDVYNEFLDRVGTDPACRDAITALQRRVLGADRAWFTEKTRTESEANGYTYDIVGDRDVAMESGVVDAFFAFWQYSPQSACANVPDAATATNDEVWGWFEGVSPLTVYADQSVGYYTPYYYQAAYQLGAPEPYETRISDLLRHPGADVALTFVPDELEPIDFDERAMPRVDRWVRTSARRMLYVYGGNDPWSAEPFDCGRHGARRECTRYYVAGGTHGSRISQLPAEQQDAARAMVLEWAGLTPADPAAKQIARTGHPRKDARLDVKPDYLRRRGL
jgi:hypothetical protein